MSATLTVRELAPMIRDLHRRYGHTRTWVYAIQAGEGGPVKIGTAKTPWERLKTLQTGNHEDLRGLAAWRAWPVEEKQIHKEFAHAHIRGEWFHPDPDLIELVLRLGDDFCDWEKP